MILVVTLNVDTGNNPTILSLTNNMKQIGQEVVLFSIVKQKFNSVIPTISVDANLHSGKDIFIKSPVFFFKSIYCLLKHKPDIIVGIDPFGIIVASFFFRIVRIFKVCKLHYWSFEMLFKSEGFRLKTIETYACKKLDTLVIQDKVRLKMLCEENKIEATVRHVLIPVSSASSEYVPTFNKIGISEKNKDQLKIIVWGTIDRWSGLDWIAELNIPDHISLVVHSRFKINPESEVYQLLGAKRNVVLHDVYFDDEIEALNFLSSFDYGICLYIPQSDNIYLGNNLKFIGLYSGKFSMFAQAGLPVIANNSFQCKLLEEYGAGIAVDNLNDLQDLFNCGLVIDEDNYNKMRLLSRKMYEDVLHPGNGIKSYLKLLY